MTSDFDLHPLRACRDGGHPAADFAELLGGHHGGGYIDTRDGGTLRCRPPLWTDHDEAERRFFFAGRRSAEFNLDYAFPPGYLAVFPQARLIGEGYVVIAGDHHVVTDSYSGDHVLERDGRFQLRALQVDAGGRRQRLPFVLRRRQGPERSVGGVSLLPAHYWHFNYHHWLIDCLPRLRYALEQPELADCRVIVPARAPAFQPESLDLLGVPAERRLLFDAGEWRLETLLFPSINAFSPSDLAWLRARLLGASGVREAPDTAATLVPTPPGSARLFVSRADAATRRLINEAEIAAALEPLGFEVLTLTGMPVAEQVRRFARAELIVGPHGSGLTNALFAPPGAALIELMPRDHVNHCFWLLANTLGQRYGFLSGAVASPERDFGIAPDRLRAMVEALSQST